jgi:phosphate starvation-inducible PhoH-like protein
MRGRTLNTAFVILDEAQNTTPEQMKMFLTRIGFGSKAVVTGDVSQIDLPKTQLSGLIDAERVLKRVPGIAICRLTSADGATRWWRALWMPTMRPARQRGAATRDDDLDDEVTGAAAGACAQAV